LSRLYFRSQLVYMSIKNMIPCCNWRLSV
jgi:hypothetical protein